MNLYRIRLSILLKDLSSFVVNIAVHRSALLGLVVLMIFVVTAILAPWIVPHDPYAGDIGQRLMYPSLFAQFADPDIHREPDPAFLLGTDPLGRDMLSRIIYGARISLLVGIVAVGISILIGTILGATAGYYGGWFDKLISRFADLLLAFPFLIFGIFVMVILGPGLLNLIFALCFKAWVEFFRLVRGEFLSEKTKEYVEAAKVTGQSSFRIIASEILPNTIHSVIVLGTLRIGFMIIMEASLSFLGLGVSPHIPAWGSMINAGRPHMLTAWWVSTLPGIAMLILVLSINLLGEGLRDILDPRLKID